MGDRAALPPIPVETWMTINGTARRPRRVIARTVLFGTSALLAAALLTWSPSATSGWNQGSAEGTLWQLLNGARTNNGMAPLQQHGGLVGIARWRSSDMLQRDYFSHTIPGCNCLVYAYYDSNGIAWDWAGENIGWNSGLDDGQSPVSVHEQFMSSPGHRANVLTAAFTHGAVGAAAADGQMFQGYVQNTRMYTELFLQAPGAAPAPAPAPAPPPAGGGGSAPVAQQPAAAPAPASDPEPAPSEATVAAPSRPTSSAGLDGTPRLVVGRSAADVAARLAADDALGIPRSTSRFHAAAKDVAPVGEMEVLPAAPRAEGVFDGLLGGLLAFLFG
jgi:uncharacterized protein YkwD